MGEPFTPCKLRRVGGPEIPVGTFLLGVTTAWRVDRVAGQTLHCTRWPLDEVPGDAPVCGWQWNPRPRSAR
jgi:hypothetical protein